MAKTPRPFEKTNMKLRIYALVALAVLISTAAASLFSYSRYTADLRTKVSLSNQQLLEQAANNLDSYFDDLARLSLVPAYNTSLVNELEQSGGGFQAAHLELENRRSIENFLDEMMIYPRQDILHAFIISGRQVFYGSRMRPTIDWEQDPTTLDWYAQVQNMSGGPIYLGPHQDPLLKNDSTTVFSVVNIIRSLKNSRAVLAYIKINADFSVINNICGQIDLGPGSGLLLVDAAGNELFCSAPKNRGIEPEQLAQSKNGSTPDGEFLVYRMELPRPGWMLYGVVEQESLQKQAKQTSRMSLLIGAGCAVAALFLVLLALKALLAPLYKIMSLARQVGGGNFKVRFPADRRDEVGLLGRSMNEVVQQLDASVQKNTQLENKVIRAQLVEKEAQVSMLYSQIQPHFIYNTMNMISMLVELDRGEAAVKNIQRLSLLLRSMSKSNTMHPLADEVQLLRAYLEIQASRYGERLAYEILLPAGLEQCAVPTLILQPIVENAVIHCCEEACVPVHVQIALRAEAGALIATVKDDGAGMDEAALKRIRQRVECSDEAFSAEGPGTGGTGLRNVNRRIQIRYGERYGLSIQSSPGRGTTVTLRLPAQEGEKL